MDIDNREIKRAIMAGEDELARLQLENDRLKQSRDDLVRRNNKLIDEAVKAMEKFEIEKTRRINAIKKTNEYKTAVSVLTAERSKWLRKIKRLENKGKANG